MRPRPAAAFAFLLVIAMATGRARAETAPAAGEATPSYRWQIGIADGAAAAILYTTYEMIDRRAYSGSKALLTVGLGTYLLGGPVIHAAHHNGGRAALSLVVRTLLPCLGAGLGRSYRPAGLPNDVESNKGLIMGAVVGMTVASLTDVLAIARPDEPVASNVQPSRPVAPAQNRTGDAAETVAFAPSLLITGERTMVGLAGRF